MLKRYSAIVICLSCVVAFVSEPPAARAASPQTDGPDYYASITELSARLNSGQLTSAQLVTDFTDRIEKLDRRGPTIRSVLELNPDAMSLAKEQDAIPYTSGTSGLLHGIPILVKGNIDTADKLTTTAGSLALMAAPPSIDATLVEKLRSAGAVLLGKANLSEWANYRSTHSTSGWSAQGGLTRNPYVLDRSACGSSSGSAAAVAAGFVTVAIGTETNGSVICPSAVNGVVGLKPTVGLVSRAGIIPISVTQDTAGIMARSVRDAAIVLGAMAGTDARDPATIDANEHLTNYLSGLKRGALRGKRIGAAEAPPNASPEVKRLYAEALDVLKAQGATIVTSVKMPDPRKYADAERTVLSYEFKDGINRYLATRIGLPVHTLDDLIAWNEAHARAEMPWFGQEQFIAAAKTDSLASEVYLKARSALHDNVAGGLDEAMRQGNLDAFVAPATGPAWTIDLVNGDHVSFAGYGAAAEAGYPSITVPSGFVHELPVGIVFIGGKWSDSLLLDIAYGYEQATNKRRNPKFINTMPPVADLGPQDMK